MSASAYRLYHYWRSSSSWRVRLALEWKGLTAEMREVHLLNGESESAEHIARNPAGFVPVLELLPNHTYLTESLAIIRFLEETHPEAPTLLPGNAVDRAKIWAMAEVINAGTQPIQNIPVAALHSTDPTEQKKWIQHWIKEGLQVFEILSKQSPGKFAYGNEFSLADALLIPQVYNAERWEVSLESFPRIREAIQNSANLEAVLRSHPDRYAPKS